jgi:hypothetical protein
MLCTNTSFEPLLMDWQNFVKIVGTLLTWYDAFTIFCLVLHQIWSVQNKLTTFTNNKITFMLKPRIAGDKLQQVFRLTVEHWQHGGWPYWILLKIFTCVMMINLCDRYWNVQFLNIDLYFLTALYIRGFKVFITAFCLCIIGMWEG